MPDLAPDEIDEHFAPARADAVYTVEIEGEAVLLDETVNRLHLLNPTAALLWQLFDGEATIRELVGEISDELGVPYDTILADTLAIVRNLGSEGLINGVTPLHARDEAARDDSLAREDPPPGSPRFLDEPPNS